MVKLVNVYPNAPITTVNPPIRTRMINVNMSVEDIRKCLIATAYVEEVLSGRRTIALDFSNYNKNNDDGEIVSVRFVDAANHITDPSTDSEVIVDTKHLNVEVDKDASSEVKDPETVQPDQSAEIPTQPNNTAETKDTEPEQPAPVDEVSAQSDDTLNVAVEEDVEPEQPSLVDEVSAQSDDMPSVAVETETTEKKSTVKTNISRNNSKKAYVKPQNKK